jgi:hypothetical protein
MYGLIVYRVFLELVVSVIEKSFLLVLFFLLNILNQLSCCFVYELKKD